MWGRRVFVGGWVGVICVCVREGICWWVFLCG